MSNKSPVFPPPKPHPKRTTTATHLPHQASNREPWNHHGHPSPSPSLHDHTTATTTDQPMLTQIRSHRGSTASQTSTANLRHQTQPLHGRPPTTKLVAPPPRTHGSSHTRTPDPRASLCPSPPPPPTRALSLSLLWCVKPPSPSQAKPDPPPEPTTTANQPPSSIAHKIYREPHPPTVTVLDPPPTLQQPPHPKPDHPNLRNRPREEQPRSASQPWTTASQPWTTARSPTLSDPRRPPFLHGHRTPPLLTQPLRPTTQNKVYHPCVRPP